MSTSNIGPYQLIEFLDSGSFGNVYKCRNVLSGLEYACKIIDRNIKNNPKDFQNFKNELEIHSRMAHPGIIQLYDVQLDNKFIYIIMELSNSGNLEQIVDESGGIGEARAAGFFKQIMEAIHYIHERGVAHRDITLQNILISEGDVAKLSDFGLCKHQPKDCYLTTTCGTFVYTSPEVIQGMQYDGLKSDIWSAGICLYAMTCNHLPWMVDDDLPPDKVWEETQKQICSGDFEYDDIQSEPLRDLLSQMLTVDPTYRPDSEEVLAHPWLSMAEEREPLDIPEPDPDLINLVTSVIASLDEA